MLGVASNLNHVLFQSPKAFWVALFPHSLSFLFPLHTSPHFLHLSLIRKSLTHSFTLPHPILLQNRSQETFSNSFQSLLSFLWSGNKSLDGSVHQWPARSARYLHPHTVAQLGRGIIDEAINHRIPDGSNACNKGTLTRQKIKYKPT